MKTIAILLFLSVSSFSFGQCLTVSNFYWHNDNTYDIDVTNENPTAQWVICPDGSVTIISGLTTITCTGTLTISGTTISPLQFVGLLPVCAITFTPDQSVFITNQNTSILNSGCTANCSGSICLNDNSGAPLNFTSPSGNSTDGCLTGLCAGNYIITPEAVLSNGVNYYFDDIQVEVSDFEAEVVLSGLTATINVLSGSGNYSFEIFDSSGTLFSTQSTDSYTATGCYEFTVTDTQTNCTFSETLYIGNLCPEDLINDGIINALDLLVLLGSINNPFYNPATDFNCDGSAGAGDLLQFLGVMGTTCN